jgi:hypothetical protein
MTPAELLSTLLPISDGRFSVSLEPTDVGVRLRYRGAEQTGSWWSPGPEREVDEAIALELPAELDERLELALRSWAEVMREAVTELAKSERPSLSAKEVFDPKVLRDKSAISEQDFRQRWRWSLASALPFQPELIDAERALHAHFEKDGSRLAQGETETLATSLEYVNTERRGGGLNLVVRLIVWDRNGDEQRIRDVKEQEVVFLEPGPGLEPERIIAFLEAFADCAGKWLAKTDPDVLMPHDVLLSPQSYKSGKTAEDFKKLLRRKLKVE